MSASVIVLIPVVLLGVVTALCFVGCVLNTHGYGFGPYQDPIRQTMGVVSLWPLDDGPPPDSSPPPPTALDVADDNNGTYNGNFTLKQTGIVPGDTGTNGLTPCASFNGGFVSVKFSPTLNTDKFTVEAWVKPNWAPGDMTSRGVVVSLAMNESAGYALFVDNNNSWTAGVSTGTTLATTSLPIMFDAFTTYLAMTFDGSKLTLFAGVAVPGQLPGNLANNFTMIPAGTFVKEMPMMTETPLFIGMGRPDLQNGDDPFNGSIQDVAYYNVPLSQQDLQGHFNLGVPG